MAVTVAMEVMVWGIRITIVIHLTVIGVVDGILLGILAITAHIGIGTMVGIILIMVAIMAIIGVDTHITTVAGVVTMVVVGAEAVMADQFLTAIQPTAEEDLLILLRTYVIQIHPELQQVIASAVAKTVLHCQEQVPAAIV